MLKQTDISFFLFLQIFKIDLGFRFQDVSSHFFKLNKVICQRDLHFDWCKQFIILRTGWVSSIFDKHLCSVSTFQFCLM